MLGTVVVYVLEELRMKAESDSNGGCNIYIVLETPPPQIAKFYKSKKKLKTTFFETRPEFFLAGMKAQ